MSTNSTPKAPPIVFGIILLSVLMLAITAYCGMLTERWTPFTGLSDARAKLKELPLTIGDWEAEGEGVLAKEDVIMLQIENGYISRRYKNSKTQAVVNLVLMIGKTGLIVVHTPEVCFGGKNYEKEETRSVVSFPIVDYSGVGPTDDEFWKVNFVNRAAQGGTISFYYGVSVGDSWIAAENPRSSLQRFRYVYKIQAEAMVDGETDNVHLFLSDCLPTIHEYMLPYK